MAAVSLLVLPLEWLLGAGMAAAFHELCHIAALRLFGVKVWKLRIGSSGAVIETEPVSCGRELACALAGPVGSLFLLLFIRIMPVLSFCGLIQGIFNLIPIYPLDGGRALKCIARMLFPGRAEKISGFAEITAVILLAALGFVFAWKLQWGFGAALVIFLLIHRLAAIKFPCKAGHERVQ